MRPLYLVIPVWGEAYTAAFLDVSLPYLLSAGNLPDLRSPGDWRVQIYTSVEDSGSVQRHSNAALLREIAPLDIVTVGARDDLVADPFPHMNASFFQAVQAAGAVNGGVCCIGPDAVFSRGSFTFVEGVWASGYRCMFEIAHRALLEPFQEALRAEEACMSRVRQGVSSAVLVRLMLSNVHPWTTSQMVGRMPRALARRTAGVIAGLGPEALAGLTWLAHPILFDPARASDRFEDYLDHSIDIAIPFATTLEAGEIFYSIDSEDFYAAEFSTMAKALTYKARQPSDHEAATDDEIANSLAEFFLTDLHEKRPREDLGLELFKRTFVTRAGPLADLPRAGLGRLEAIRERALDRIARSCTV